MTAEQVFSIGNTIALLGWLLLVTLGPRRWVAPLITGAILPLLFAVLYGSLLAAHWGETPGGGFGSLAQVAALFSNPWLLLAGWVHYLAFDLFIGSWEVRDAPGQRHPALVRDTVPRAHVSARPAWSAAVFRSSRGTRAIAAPRDRVEVALAGASAFWLRRSSIIERVPAGERYGESHKTGERSWRGAT